MRNHKDRRDVSQDEEDGNTQWGWNVSHDHDPDMRW